MYVITVVGCTVFHTEKDVYMREMTNTQIIDRAAITKRLLVCYFGRSSARKIVITLLKMMRKDTKEREQKAISRIPPKDLCLRIYMSEKEEKLAKKNGANLTTTQIIDRAASTKHLFVCHYGKPNTWKIVKLLRKIMRKDTTDRENKALERQEHKVARMSKKRTTRRSKHDDGSTQELG